MIQEFLEKAESKKLPPTVQVLWDAGKFVSAWEVFKAVKAGW